MIASEWNPQPRGDDGRTCTTDGSSLYSPRVVYIVSPDPSSDQTGEEKALWWREFFIAWHKKVRIFHRLAVYRVERMVRTFFKRVKFHLRLATKEVPSFHWHIHVREGL